MSRGFSLLEVVISLTILTIFIFGGMSAYTVSLSQEQRARMRLTAAWLAKGKLDSAADALVPSSGKFQPPFEEYAFQIRRTPLRDYPALQLMTVEVNGPNETHVKLRRIAVSSP